MRLMTFNLLIPCIMILQQNRTSKLFVFKKNSKFTQFTFRFINCLYTMNMSYLIISYFVWLFDWLINWLLCNVHSRILYTYWGVIDAGEELLNLDRCWERYMGFKQIGILSCYTWYDMGFFFLRGGGVSPVFFLLKPLYWFYYNNVLYMHTFFCKFYTSFCKIYTFFFEICSIFLFMNSTKHVWPFNNYDLNLIK